MRIIATLFIITLATVALAQQIDREAIATAEVTRYVEHWTRNLSPAWRRRAMRHVPSVAHWSVHYGVDPLLTAVVVSLESSWNPGARGGKGEIGLMQIKNRRAKACMRDPNDPDEQIRCGVWWLRQCIDECRGNVKQGVNKYTTGSCTKPWPMLGYRMCEYKRAVRRFRR